MNITLVDVLNAEIRQAISWPPKVGEISGAERPQGGLTRVIRRRRAPWRKARHLARRGNRR
jgi:hypothetical protein